MKGMATKICLFESYFLVVYYTHPAHRNEKKNAIDLRIYEFCSKEHEEKLSVQGKAIERNIWYMSIPLSEITSKTFHAKKKQSKSK